MMWPARRGGDRFGDGAGSGGARLSCYLLMLCHAMLAAAARLSVLCAKYLAVNATHSAAQQMAESEWEKAAVARVVLGDMAVRMAMAKATVAAAEAAGAVMQAAIG